MDVASVPVAEKMVSRPHKKQAPHQDGGEEVVVLLDAEALSHGLSDGGAHQH